jgi:hypothetical protein
MGIYDKDGKLNDAGLAISNPFEYFQKDIMPKVIAAGNDTKAKQLEFFERIFSRNPAETAALLGINPVNVERTAASIGRVNSLDAANLNQNANDPFAALSQSIAAMKNFGATFAGPMIPGITSNLAGFASGLDKATSHLASLFGAKTADEANKALFGGDDKTPWLMKWIEGNWQNDKRLFGNTAQANGGGPGDSFVGWGAVHGRDPRSPQSGTLAYTPPSAPVSVTVSAPNVDVRSTTTVTLDGASIAAAVATRVEKMVTGALTSMFSSMGSHGTNSDSGFDGRAHPSYPDTMHGTH